MPCACVLEAWDQHEGELRAWLRRRMSDDHAADDLLQSLFLRAIRQGDRFCEVRRARSWLFAAARNAVIDHHRVHKTHVPLPETLSAETDDAAPVHSLAQCLPRALSELSDQDADVLRRCDLGSETQVQYAREQGLSVAGAKSRLQRARARLRDQLTEACAVQFDERGDVCCFVPREVFTPSTD